MRFRKIYSYGKILDNNLYETLQELDINCPFFKGCANEFKENRDWWVITDNKGEIIAYCGSGYKANFAIFVRAWVKRNHRGKGLQKKMIKLRINAAKKRNCESAITYITPDNPASGNSLIGCGFKLYTPEWEYAGKEMIYFIKNLY